MNLGIYADTSVIGGCLDVEFRDESMALLNMVRRGEAVLLVHQIRRFNAINRFHGYQGVGIRNPREVI